MKSWWEKSLAECNRLTIGHGAMEEKRADLVIDGYKGTIILCGYFLSGGSQTTESLTWRGEK